MKKPLFILFLVIIFEIALLINNKILYSSHQVISNSDNKCEDTLSNSNRQQCWEDLLEKSLKQNGIKEAFVIFDNLYRNEPEFVSTCHDYAHILGASAYKILIEGDDLDFPPQTAFCGYGFYHGLTEQLLQTNGAKGAAKLCDSKKSQIAPVLYDACYHGIGHGALSQTAKYKEIWGNIQKMIDVALNTCKMATDDLIERSRCASGVFMELGNDYIEGQLKLISIKNDPLSICRNQQEFTKMDCYTQMNGVLNMIAGGKLNKSARFVEDIDEDKYAIEAIITLAVPAIDITKNDYTDDIEVCRSLQKRLHLPCIQGLALGFILKGQPGIEYEKTIDFCNSIILYEEEKQSCFNLLLRYSKHAYTVDKVSTICSKVEPRYKKDYCLSN